MVATSRDSLNRVVKSNNVGNEVKSRGLLRNKATISTRIDEVTERDKPISRIKVGSGNISIDKSAETDSASPISEPGIQALSALIPGGRLKDENSPSNPDKKFLPEFAILFHTLI
ncbi:hypothetical protein GRO01_22200 [Gluconobacter roseus NBRC 3990]|uniref:Uncharacterized protein n=1 Tax=Gluconobacter roseus NBRC 3990 TaxID=1307950 RepID=A0A4Y3M7H4_9PROT|nr:hypothetical protein AA3990_1698 [Gluconobacter roseus NBRC 3990]GEB04644.1 hypothetical protein GRO01_22200 [Gluconobacter roseus NBRC 3990]GLP92221.1 hypothetical protein GCM10007871_01990 [Gluconobacter roseus NBRC 3990]